MLSCKYYEISKSTYFQEHLYTAASKVSLGSDCFTTFLLNSRYQTVWFSNITKVLAAFKPEF